MKNLVCSLVSFLLLAVAAPAKDQPTNGDCINVKFRACDDTEGGGFFWVDTQTGRTWRMNPDTKIWVYCGRPDGAMPDAYGTYVPRKNGVGIFILNTSTGEGWWTDGTQWKKLGIPMSKQPADVGV